MGAIVVLLAIVGALVMYGYVSFLPPYANKKQLSIYDMMVLSVCVLLCLAWFFNARAEWKGSEYDDVWMLLGIMGVFAIEIVFLTVFFLIRNFWIFKPPRRPGSGLFR